ncbi:MAG: DUF1517 domain-containing protein [Cyanobacteria bacterium P01_D01_bin.73]
MGIGDRLRRMTGKTRFVVSRVFVHLSGSEATPMLGILNQAARNAIDADGEMEVLGEGLVAICEGLLQYDAFWRSAGNEGEVFWDEGEAGDFVNELFTDSASRYLSEVNYEEMPEDDLLTLPPTGNLVVMVTVAYEGELETLETNLADYEALKEGLRSLISLTYGESLRTVQVHYSPAQLGDELTDEQVLLNFPEVVPL